MKYKAVLWDFDGTLADTLPGLLEIYNQLAAKRGFRPIDDPQPLRGLTPLVFLRKQGIPLVKLPSLLRAMMTAQKERIAAARLVPGLADLLHTIRRQGQGMSILSSNIQENILSCLRANGVAEIFDRVVGYPRLFGKAKGIRRLLKALTLHASEVIYIGDEVRDIEAAQQARVDMAAVTWGLNTAAVLAQHRPTYLIERPEQIRDILF